MSKLIGHFASARLRNLIYAEVSNFYLTFTPAYDTIKREQNLFFNGAWRSPEARLNGVQEVAGSNPVAPIFNMKYRLASPTYLTFASKPRSKCTEKRESQ